jgi:hypothetical protein
VKGGPDAPFLQVKVPTIARAKNAPVINSEDIKEIQFKTTPIILNWDVRMASLSMVHLWD